MATNKTFSLKRFCYLVYNDLLICGKSYALYTACFGIIMYLALLWAMHESYCFRIIEYAVFLMLSCIVAGIIIGNAFPDFNSKIKTANYLLLPASIPEKFLSQFLVRMVFTTVLLAAIFRFDAYLARCSISVHDRMIAGQPVEEFSYSEMFSRINTVREWVICFAIFSTMSFLFSMRLFFKKYAIVKTLFSGILLIIGFISVFSLYSLIFYTFSPEEISWMETVRLQGYKIHKDIYNIQLYFYCVACISWVFFLLTGYFKLKEKQI